MTYLNIILIHILYLKIPFPFNIIPLNMLKNHLHQFKNQFMKHFYNRCVVLIISHINYLINTGKRILQCQSKEGNFLIVFFFTLVHQWIFSSVSVQRREFYNQ